MNKYCNCDNPHCPSEKIMKKFNKHLKSCMLEHPTNLYNFCTCHVQLLMIATYHNKDCVDDRFKNLNEFWKDVFFTAFRWVDEMGIDDKE